MANSSQATGSPRQVGQELSQLAGFLFGQASSLWWRSRALEIIAGLIVVFVTAFDAGKVLSGFGAVVATGLIVAAYVMRLFFEDKYDTAETMRRQSVLCEGLDWRVSSWQKSEWERKAGKKLLNRLSAEPRVNDYYGSHSPPGPKRLAEMTLESEFYTRHQYVNLRNIAWTFVAVTSVGTLVVLLASANQTVPETWGLLLAKAIFVAIPIVLTADFLGWAFRLQRITGELDEVENGLDRQLELAKPVLTEVMRLVSEYNCKVVAGIPIPARLWNQWHDQIRALWERR